MFFENIWGSPTVYNFPSPPGLVLDVGCGTGWWVMNMARRWPVCLLIPIPRCIVIDSAVTSQNTVFVGFDVAEIQPQLGEYEHFGDISDRIRWINGNLYVCFVIRSFLSLKVHPYGSLDVFPFPDDHFDYVRVCRAGLAIPEDEAGYLHTPLQCFNANYYLSGNGSSTCVPRQFSYI